MTGLGDEGNLVDGRVADGLNGIDTTVDIHEVEVEDLAGTELAVLAEDHEVVEARCGFPTGPGVDAEVDVDDADTLAVNCEELDEAGCLGSGAFFFVDDNEAPAWCDEYHERRSVFERDNTVDGFSRWGDEEEVLVFGAGHSEIEAGVDVAANDFVVETWEALKEVEGGSRSVKVDGCVFATGNDELAMATDAPDLPQFLINWDLVSTCWRDREDAIIRQ